MLDQMEVAHTNLSKITRVVLVKIDSVVVLTTGITATAWVLAVLSNTTTTIGNVATKATTLLQSRRHFTNRPALQ